TGCSTVSRAWATKCSRPWRDTPASAYGKPMRCWRGFLARHATSLLCEKGTDWFSPQKSCLSPFIPATGSRLQSEQPIIEHQEPWTPGNREECQKPEQFSLPPANNQRRE